MSHEMRLGGYAPPGATHSRALEHLAEGIRLATDAHADVDVSYNVMDQGRPATDLLDMVESGELSLCYFSSSYLVSRVPELAELEQPFLFATLEQAHAALDGDLGRRLSEATEAQTGFEVLGYWDNGFRHLTNRLRPVHAPSDVVGMRIRLQPSETHASMVEAWGGVPVMVELSEGIQMIRRGEVDAQENPLANTVAYGVQEHHRYVTLTAHLFGARGIYANRQAMAAMPQSFADAVRAAATSAIEFQRSIAAAYEAELRTHLESEGILFVDLTPDQRSAFDPS